MKKLKILHINDIASVASTLVSEQRKMGHQVFLREIKTPLASSNLILKSASFPLRLYDSLKIRRMIKKENIDIIHVHFVSAGIFFLFLKKTLIIHAHGSDIRIKRKFSLRKIINWFILKNSSMLFYSTPDLKPFTKEYKITSFFIPNPIDLNLFYERCPPVPNSILLYSSISKIKGAPNAITALLKLKKKYPKIEISCFNYGDLIEQFSNLPFKYLNKTKRENLPRIISEHEIIIGQTHLGAIGMSELEALACERTVLTCFEYQDAYDLDVPIVNVKSSNQIANSIEKIFTEIEEVKISKKKESREWVKKFHSAESISKLVLLKYYENL